MIFESSQCAQFEMAGLFAGVLPFFLSFIHPSDKHTRAQAHTHIDGASKRQCKAEGAESAREGRTAADVPL